MATSTTVFSRVTVVAPSTRIDVALPADVSIADLMPMILDMARENSPDGGARHGGWALAKLGGEQLDPGHTLASLGIVDGDLLQLRKRSDNPPPPLYDDVVDAIAAATPGSFRPWTKTTARRIAHIGAGAALVAAALALFYAGPFGGGPSIGPAVAGGVAALVLIGIAGSLARVYDAPGTAVLISAAGAIPMAFIAGLYAVPEGPKAPNLLLGSVLIVVFAAASIWLIGRGVTVFIAFGAAGVLGFVAFLIGTFVDATPAAIASGAAAVALVGISLLPRVTIQLARLPLPNVPTNAEDLKETGPFPDFAQIEKRSGMAHEYLTGLIVGCGAVAAVSAIVTAGHGTIWGFLLAIVISLVLMLRGRSYANGAQAIALLATGMVAAAGVAIGWLTESSPLTRILYIFGVLVIVAAASLVIGVIFPEQKFSPVMRRTVDIIEGVLIAAVLPLALAVMELYDTVRHLRIGG
ncbi:type VII secretion integral membrane protein EccD [Sciscionella marina]|uniref:type VII secretion integral membrane protein EccD n=1 Tax=Sciscionella marina TaxID=508770 RepID=UPI0003772660|nr:type VII secretion integral membrane protein EccD [Sciscionella marina]